MIEFDSSKQNKAPWFKKEKDSLVTNLVKKEADESVFSYITHEHNNIRKD